MNMYHVHPKNPMEKIFGRVVRVGEKLKKGDVWDSPSGKWKSIKDELVGTVVKKNDTRTFIRSAR